MPDTVIYFHNEDLKITVLVWHKVKQTNKQRNKQNHKKRSTLIVLHISVEFDKQLNANQSWNFYKLISLVAWA